MRNAEQFSEMVINRIQKERTSLSVNELFYEFIFGWVYIGWIRKSMVAAAIFLMLYFGYQQAEMMKKVDALSSRSVVEMNVEQTGIRAGIDARFKIYPIFGKKAFERKMEISEKEKLDKFIKSMKDLRDQNKDILQMIEADPQLKKYVEDRLNKDVSVKPKI